EQEFIDAYSKDTGSTLKMFLRMYKRFLPQILVSYFFYLIQVAPAILSPIITANLINAASDAVMGKIGPEETTSKIIINIAILVGFLIFNVPMNILRTRYMSKVMRKIEVGLRGALVQKLQHLSISFHREMQSGRIQSKLMRDVETIQGLSHQLFEFLPQVLINMVTSLIVVITRNMTIFAFFLMCVPMAVLTTRAFRKPIMNNNMRFRKGMEKTSANLMDMVEMTEITRAHALEDKEISKMTGILNEVASTGFRLDIIQALFGACSWVVFQIFQLLTLSFSVFMVVRGVIAIGDISMYQAYFSSLTGQVSALIGMMPMITKGIDSVSSLSEILSSDRIEENEGKPQLEELKGEYEFKDVEFSYDDNVPLLKDFNLKIKAGETIAIVGESGAGKTTLLNLVIGFILPKKGKLLIDGKDITQIDLRSYRNHLAVVPQNSVMFTGTIKDNITYGLDNVTDERLNEILEAAQLKKFIDSLPDGVNTKLDERAANVSGGQRQRLSIARALIRDPDVIIFDEATSALDTVSEKEIQKAINNMSKDRTTFIVAHRLSTIKDADRIAVIKNGVCCEIGTFDELIAQKGEFYAMQTLQSI
ncbi:MAG: ABC transporter ATP-binding protein, partial [Clostridia bacterium]|nr:ABC transporter ATP-binding protein [Clostridia bacterium]